VSLDTLDRDRFRRLAHRDRLDDVLAGLSAAASTSLHPIKVNTVLMPQINRDEAPRLLRWALRGGFELRFIEQMPLDAQGGWDRAAMVTAREILADLASCYQLQPASVARGSAPAELWAVQAGDDHPAGRVGVIAAVTRSFCAACDRTRLTADGMLRNCLFAHDETDLRVMLRGGASDAELADVWRGTMWRKRAGHGIDDPRFTQPARPMSAIGG
jgi:cyclic pyranopterin phosphate synthase